MNNFGIIEQVNFSQFCDAWNRFEDRKNSFSYKGKRALFDYLEEYAYSTGEPVELDIIALDCEYVEYKTALEIATEYSRFAFNGEFATEEEALEFLRDNTQVIEFDGGIIIQQF